MNSFRFARAALRARPAAMRVPAQRRTYAEAVPDKASCLDPSPVPRPTANLFFLPTDQAQLRSPSPGTQLTRYTTIFSNAQRN